MSSHNPETVIVPQLQSQATARVIDIFYPSGQRQRVKAVYRGPWGMATGEFFVMISVPSSEPQGARTARFDELMGLNPLCVLVDALSSQVIYEPRMVMESDGFPDSVKTEWRAVANWPQLLEFTKDEAGNQFV
jgi:hypothetical protein